MSDFEAIVVFLLICFGVFKIIATQLDSTSKDQQVYKYEQSDDEIRKILADLDSRLRKISIRLKLIEDKKNGGITIDINPHEKEADINNKRFLDETETEKPVTLPPRSALYKSKVVDRYGRAWK